jgi:hypothetical protein
MLQLLTSCRGQAFVLSVWHDWIRFQRPDMVRALEIFSAENVEAKSPQLDCTRGVPSGWNQLWRTTGHNLELGWCQPLQHGRGIFLCRDLQCIPRCRRTILLGCDPGSTEIRSSSLLLLRMVHLDWFVFPEMFFEF